MTTLEVSLESTSISLLFAPDPAATTVSTNFTATLTYGEPVSIGLSGKSITFNFGDGTGNFTSSTLSNGVASLLHTYSADGTYSASATFQGELLHMPCIWCNLQVQACCISALAFVCNA